MSEIDATYIITGDDLNPLAYENDEPIEFASHTAAIKRGKQELAELSDDREVWIWRLCSVLSKTVSMDVEEVA